MKPLRKILFNCFAIIFAIPLFAAQGQITQANGIDIWYETFGEKSDPACLLIMGAMCQGILWPTEFCEQLAKEKLYVIRYDHRDAGFSTCFDFRQHPYTLLDMAKDGIGLLDSLGIEKAHLVGLSMGGPIAELMSVHFPKRVSTITLMATSCDFRPMTFALDGVSLDSKLSLPKENYLNWTRKFLAAPSQTGEEMLEERLVCWSILNGSVVPFEKERYREIHREFLSRVKHPESIANHKNSWERSFEMIQTIPYQVRVPTLILHGSEDPIFPPDHGEALAKAISGSKLIPVHGFGHVPNRQFYDLFIANIKELTVLKSTF